MAKVSITVCNRCGHSKHEDDFEGMDVTIFDLSGLGSYEDQFTLCDPCVAALRTWLATKPVAELETLPGGIVDRLDAMEVRGDRDD